MDKIVDIKKKLEARYRDSSELFPDFTSAKEIEVVPSPSAIVNLVTGLGGFPRGRVTEIHGPYSSGKTTLATEISVTAQKMDPKAVVLFVDYEHAFDATYGYKLGLDLDPERFVFVQPEYFEQGARVIHEFVDRDLVDLICIDSAAAMTPKVEMEGEWDKDGGSIKGLQASLMARFLERITKKIPRGRKPPLIILNQTRAFINIGGRPQKNPPKEVPAGGNALKFYSSSRQATATISPVPPRSNLLQLTLGGRLRYDCRILRPLLELWCWALQMIPRTDLISTGLPTGITAIGCHRRVFMCNS